jgi:hypothetical protein
MEISPVSKGVAGAPGIAGLASGMAVVAANAGAASMAGSPVWAFFRRHQE